MIRLATTEDRERLEEIISEVDEPSITETPIASDSLVLVVEKEGKIIGFAEMRNKDNECAFVDKLVIAKEHQKKGVSLRLYGAVLYVSQWAGVSCAFAINKKNERALGMVKRMKGMKPYHETENRIHYLVEKLIHV